MAKLNPAQEPSMEEILASIRRIIAEDDAEPAAPPPPRPTAAAAPPPPRLSTESIDALFAVRPPAAKPAPRQESRADAAPSYGREAEAAPLLRPTLPPQSRTAAPPPRAETPPSRPEMPPARAEMPPAPQRELRPQPGLTRIEEPARSRPLLSADANAAVNAAFGALTGAHPAGGTSATLEDFVKEALRPMLKAWLDTNLPPLVERLVREEIERVSRGR